MKLMADDLFVQLFKVIDVDIGANLLARLEKEDREGYLSLLPAPLSREMQELMTYPPDSAGSLMDPRVLRFYKDNNVDDVLERIRVVRDRRITDICVVDAGSVLEAVISLQDVVIAQPSEKLERLEYVSPISVQAMSPREDVVRLLEEQKLASLPVVDFNGKLIGIIRHDTLVNVARQEASADLQTMFGAGKDEGALSKISFSIKKRLPWLEINLATAFLAAMVVGLFEDTIARITALAVFLPVVAGQSGNTGSQALAVTMRGLALREIRMRHWPRVVRKEMAAGFVNGCVIALTTAAVAYIWMKSIGLSVVIGTAMVFSMVIAGISGAVIPIALKAVGQDPAQSSSIVLTTVTDVFGFLSFLGLATVLANALAMA